MGCDKKVPVYCPRGHRKTHCKGNESMISLTRLMTICSDAVVHREGEEEPSLPVVSGEQANAWMNTDIFEQWCADIFLPSRLPLTTLG
mmetsp:Transcript_18176/g.50897  ORF Transcript_18176/g.50897 Transcript_18176/m.50897 type:complete len:88 (-) Transcript_18176:264-527(-)